MSKQGAANARVAGSLTQRPAPTPAPADDPVLQSRLPTETRGARGWIWRCFRTLVGVMLAPRKVFARCPEPIDHGRALMYLATLRLLPWAALVVWLGLAFFVSQGPTATPTRSIHAFIDPAAAKATSVWLLLMAPVGMPLLYLICGVVSHIAVALTGGASRSLGASMRAVGYAMGPALLAVGLLDAALYTVGVDGLLYCSIVAGLGLSFLWSAGNGLAQTHQIHGVRGFLVAMVPTLLLTGVMLVRAVLQLDDMPGISPPSSPYWVP